MALVLSGTEDPTIYAIFSHPDKKRAPPSVMLRPVVKVNDQTILPRVYVTVVVIAHDGKHKGATADKQIAAKCGSSGDMTVFGANMLSNR